MPKRIRDLPANYFANQHALAAAIGARVRLRREALEMTQEQLRARLELRQIYMSRTQYSRVENGEAMLDAGEVIALRAVLEVSFAWLLLGEEG
jgi:transcriptional regulator with XRE-family HTH domain